MLLHEKLTLHGLIQKSLAKPFVLSVKPLFDDLKKFISEYETAENVEAIKLANSGVNLFAITGYAGTGKTTVSKAILQLFEKNMAKNLSCVALFLVWQPIESKSNQLLD